MTSLIQELVNSTPTNGTLRLEGGTYDAGASAVTVAKSMNIIGRPGTIIKGTGPSVLHIQASSYSVFEGFELQPAAGKHGLHLFKGASDQNTHLTFNQVDVTGGAYSLSCGGADGANDYMRFVDCHFDDATTMLAWQRYGMATGWLFDGCHFTKSPIGMRVASDMKLSRCNFFNVPLQVESLSTEGNSNYKNIELEHCVHEGLTTDAMQAVKSDAALIYSAKHCAFVVHEDNDWIDLNSTLTQRLRFEDCQIVAGDSSDADINLNSTAQKVYMRSRVTANFTAAGAGSANVDLSDNWT